MRRHLGFIALFLILLLAGAAALAQEGTVRNAAPGDSYVHFGVTYDAEGRMYYEGKRIRYFFDGYELADGSCAVRDEYVDAAGIVDVHTVRAVVDNGDGSVDPFGELLAIVPYSEAEFRARDVQALLNPPEQVAVTALEDGAGACRALETGAPCATSAVTEGEAAQAGDGRTLAQRLNAYAGYGLCCETNDAGEVKLYYQGARVRSFVDEGPNGVFSYTSTMTDGLNVRVLYDAWGRATGLAGE